MNRSKVLWLAIPLMVVSSCGNVTCSQCTNSFISPEVPAGNLTTSAFFHYGDSLNMMTLTTTQTTRAVDGFDLAVGTIHENAVFNVYNDDIIHGTVNESYLKDSSESEYQYHELRYISDGYIHIIHDEDEYVNDYRVSLENNVINYREALYIGMKRDYFKYFVSAMEYDPNIIQRSGTYADGVVTLNSSFVQVAEISLRLDIAVEITDDMVTRCEVNRSTYDEEGEIMSETIIETYSHAPKQNFPWGVIDWYSYQDYIER